MHLKNMISKFYKAIIHIEKISSFKKAFRGAITRRGGGVLIFSRIPLYMSPAYQKIVQNRSINIFKKNLCVIFI